MKLANIKSSIKLAANSAKLVLKKNAPDILIAVGVTSVVGGTVLACVSTLKANEVLNEHENKMDSIAKAKELNDSDYIDKPYTDEDEKKDKIIVYTQTTLQFMKLYAPSVLLITTGLGCIMASHGIMKKRNLALMTAYNGLCESFNQYRDRVRAELGAEREKQLYLNADEVIKEGEVDKDTGEYEEKIVFRGADLKPSVYARWFDEASTEWRKNAEYNHMFLRSVQSWCNTLLQTNGHLFLNDVYKALGLPETGAGALVGWLKDEGDGYVDFGMYDVEKPLYAQGRMDFINGYERCILLDFNVCGAIYDKI